MKKCFYFALILLGCFQFSCSKEDQVVKEETGLNKTYSGVLLGSSGAYKLTIEETGAIINMVFDGDEHMLTSTETISAGESVTLTDGTVLVTFSTNSNGENPSISFEIPGHNIYASIHQNLPGGEANISGNYVGKIEFSEGVNGEELEIYAVETISMSIFEGEFVMLDNEILCIDCSESDPKTYRYEGVVVGETESAIIIKILRENEGGDTPMEELHFEDSKDSELTLLKKGGQLTSVLEDEIDIINNIEEHHFVEMVLTKVVL